MIIPAASANAASFILFATCVVVFGGAFTALHGFALLKAGFVSFLTNYVVLLLCVTMGMVIHELLHAVAFAMGTHARWQSVTFGFNMKEFAPYCHCSKDLSYNWFMLATLLPGLALGVAPLMVSLVIASGWLLAFGCFFTAGAAGDFLCAIRLFPFRGRRVRDHADSIGFLVL